jgi:hypothetical protein
VFLRVLSTLRDGEWPMRGVWIHQDAWRIILWPLVVVVVSYGDLR